MRHPDAPLGQVPLAADARADMELRILSGCHQGASVAIAAGEPLRVGSEGECDVLLSDCGLAAEAPLLVAWQGGRWSVRPAQEPAQAGKGAAVALGAAALLGQVQATVCAAHLPWTPAPPASALPLPGELPVQSQPLPPEAPAMAETATAVHAAGAGAEGEGEAVPRARRATPRRRLPLAAAGLLAGALLATGWAVWRHASGATAMHATSDTPAAAQLSPQAQEKAVKEANLAIALADPALRMQVVANPRGGVTVSGWVDSTEQFDRLAQALSSLRPLPRLAVRTAQEVFDALTDVGTAQGLSLRFAPLGAGKVQVRGVVLTAELRQQTLAQLRARAPEGIEIIDGLRVAALQGPEVVRWLGAQGLMASQAHWDGEQLVLAVEVTPSQRQQLERLLAQAQTPLNDVPFVLQTQLVKEAAAARRLSLAEAGLPFGIRSVVGGAAPYVVLADGAKLQPGGARAGWRLAAIAPDHLLFDSPRRLEVSR